MDMEEEEAEVGEGTEEEEALQECNEDIFGYVERMRQRERMKMVKFVKIRW